MNRQSKELLFFFTFLLTACTAKTKPTEAPTFIPTTPSTTSRDVYYPDVNLTYRKITIGELECTIVPPDGTMWRAAYALGDEYAMDDVDEIRLHPITNEGPQEMIAFHPKREAFPQPPRAFTWPLIHAGSLACRSITYLQP